MKKFFLLLSVNLFLVGSALFAQTIVTFSYTGAPQTFTVPACVTSINVDANGAQGGNNGGLGGRVVCTLPVNPGDVLNIYVGGAGGTQISNSPGGFNGGGTAGTSSVQNYAGCGGGGASDIRLNGSALANRVVVAGGGGGNHPINGPGGIGGGLIAGGVNNNGNTCMASWATGGSQVAGGNPSVWSGTCCQFTPVPGGSLGIGGNGCGPAIACNNGDAGSGGGGGYYGGGGGGTYTGGGGGSSYTDVSCTGVTHTAGSRSGDGSITLTFSSCVGVDDQSILNTTHLFPNPSSGILTATYPRGLNDVTLQIFDMQGRMVFTSATIAITSGNNEQFDISALSNGVYSVTISSANSLKKEKLVINK